MNVDDIGLGMLVVGRSSWGPGAWAHPGPCTTSTESSLFDIQQGMPCVVVCVAEHIRYPEAQIVCELGTGWVYVSDLEAL